MARCPVSAEELKIQIGAIVNDIDAATAVMGLQESTLEQITGGVVLIGAIDTTNPQLKATVNLAEGAKRDLQASLLGLIELRSRLLTYRDIL